MSQRLRNSTLTIQTSMGDGSEAAECAVIDPEGALQNVVIIETGTNTAVTLSASEVKAGSSEVTQPPAVLTAAAALGMNLTSATVETSTGAAEGTSTVATVVAGDHEDRSEAGSCSSGGSAGGEAPSNGGRAEGSRGNVEVLTTGSDGKRSKQQQQRVGLLLSESSQTSNRQHHQHSADPTDSGSAVAQTTVTAALKSQSAATPTTAEGSHAPNTTAAETNPESAEENQDSNSKMIDASDFRMVDPGCTYPTLAAAAAANGRMTPPNHHHHQHPHHALHHSHAMASYVNTSYTTLTPLQPLPPISTISSMQDKFQTYSPSGNEAAGGEAGGATPSNNSEGGGPPASVSNFMQSNLSPYMSMSPPHYPPGSHAAATAAAAIAMSAHSPPQTEGGAAHHYPHNGGSSLLSKQEPLSPSSYYAEAQRPSPHHDMSPHSLDHSPTGGSNGGSNAMVPTSNYEALTTNNNPSLNGGMTSPHTISPVPHTSPLLHHREMSPPSPPTAHHGNNGASILAAAAASALGQHHPHNPHGMSMPSATPTMVTLKSTPSSNNNNSGGGGGGGEAEEINTKELAQRISAELKRYSIPQAIFAQRVLCRSQGTLSDLLRNPKPWSKLKSGRETFRRMQKWLQEPEFQRMSALRLAGKILNNVFTLVLTLKRIHIAKKFLLAKCNVCIEK